MVARRCGVARKSLAATNEANGVTDRSRANDITSHQLISQWLSVRKIFICSTRISSAVIFHIMCDDWTGVRVRVRVC